MLILSPVLVVILPDLVEVERIEEFDRSVECGHNEADVLDVSEFRDGLLWRLFCLKILSAGTGCIGSAPFLLFETTKSEVLLIAHRAYILKLVLQNRVYLRLFACIRVILVDGVLLLRLDV